MNGSGGRGGQEERRRQESGREVSGEAAAPQWPRPRRGRQHSTVRVSEPLIRSAGPPSVSAIALAPACSIACWCQSERVHACVCVYLCVGASSTVAHFHSSID